LQQQSLFNKLLISCRLWDFWP